jgi:hypothetical protein
MKQGRSSAGWLAGFLATPPGGGSRTIPFSDTQSNDGSGARDDGEEANGGNDAGGHARCGKY